MANDFAGNPFIIDTIQGGDALNGQHWNFKTIRWTSPAGVSGHRAIVTNAAGRIIWESVCNGSAYAEVDHLEFKEDLIGLKIPTLDSGRLLIYIL